MPHQPDHASSHQDLAFMQMALQLGREAAVAGEVPVGAVVVKDGVVVGVGRNSPIGSCDPSAHAEMVALRAAATALGNYRLEECTLYVTLEPCAMCSGGILHSRLKRVVYGAPDPKTGSAGSVLNLFSMPQLNHHTQVEGGVLADQSSEVLQDFFRKRRALQRELARPLREDTLRTPDHCFDGLKGYPWSPRFVSDLPSLAGLRLHFVDEGPCDSGNVNLCLHPVPGWSYSYRQRITDWLGQGIRVLAPDLIGFGKSDKPKREDAHTVEFHCQYLIEWLERLDIKSFTLVVPNAGHPLLQQFTSLAHDRIRSLLVQPITVQPTNDAENTALQAPYPDVGHRAAERAFSSRHIRQAKMTL
jgi:tRNA(adenine34) deaminase